MTRVRTILFCGGGSLGHVLPSLAVREALLVKDPSLQCHFVCAPRRSETDTLRAADAAYSVLHAPKFPRALSVQMLLFPFLFLYACFASCRIFLSVKPSVVFSKGGYISIAPSVLAWCLRIPIILHASDSVPSLSDTIVGRLSRFVCTGFPLTTFPPSLQRIGEQTGNPIRSFIFHGEVARGRALTGFSGARPIVLLMGGSQGARSINEAIDRDFDALVAVADIIHLTGEGKHIHRTHPSYIAWPTVGHDIADLYTVADLVVTRAGAGAVSELAALKKAILVLPLQGVAHDHQVQNAAYLVSRGAAEMLLEDSYDTLVAKIVELLGASDRRKALEQRIASVFPLDASARVAQRILDALP